MAQKNCLQNNNIDVHRQIFEKSFGMQGTSLVQKKRLKSSWGGGGGREKKKGCFFFATN